MIFYYVCYEPEYEFSSLIFYLAYILTYILAINYTILLSVLSHDWYYITKLQRHPHTSPAHYTAGSNILIEPNGLVRVLHLISNYLRNETVSQNPVSDTYVFNRNKISLRDLYRPK